MKNIYAYYFLQSKFIEINTRAKGVGIPHVGPNILWNYDLLIPPKPTQLAIVSKIEELFSELEKGIESLFTAKQQLKTYRQSVLKWAFEGKLTNGPNCDLYDLLNEHDLNIAVENRNNQTNQKNHTSDKGELPEGWKIKSLKDICKVVGGVTKGRDFKGKETIHLPYLRVANAQDGYLDLHEIETIEVLPQIKKNINYFLEIFCIQKEAIKIN